MSEKEALLKTLNGSLKNMPETINSMVQQYQTASITMSIIGIVGAILMGSLAAFLLIKSLGDDNYRQHEGIYMMLCVIGVFCAILALILLVVFLFSIQGAIAPLPNMLSDILSSNS